MIIKVVEFEIFSIFDVVFKYIFSFAAVSCWSFVNMCDAAVLVNPILLEHKSASLTQLLF